jgi:hypothetical protein
VIVHQLDPLRDARWQTFVDQHPHASVFHTTGWLEALARTFGYRPVVFTTSPPGRVLDNGIVLCDVQSRLTGRRLVSLPFSDHCEPLVGRPEELDELVRALAREARERGHRYVELRPRTARALGGAGLEPSQSFVSHALALTAGADRIFAGLHKDCVQRKLRRAAREALTCEEGRGPELVAAFQTLLLRTCRRRHLPPHPGHWLRTLVERLGEAVTIRVASKAGRPIAAIVTLAWRDTLVYKYGCSDERHHNLGGMQFLLWRAVQDGVRRGLRELDLGRSDRDNPGLVAF